MIINSLHILCELNLNAGLHGPYSICEWQNHFSFEKLIWYACDLCTFPNSDSRSEKCSYIYMEISMCRVNVCFVLFAFGERKTKRKHSVISGHPDEYFTVFQIERTNLFMDAFVTFARLGPPPMYRTMCQLIDATREKMNIIYLLAFNWNDLDVCSANSGQYIIVWIIHVGEGRI